MKCCYTSFPPFSLSLGSKYYITKGDPVGGELNVDSRAPVNPLTGTFNPLIVTLKPQINGPSYSNTVIVTLAADGWCVLVQRGGACAGCGSHPHCTKCNSPSINGQRTNFILFDVALCVSGWRFSLVVTRWSRSTQLLYAGPG